MYIDDNYLPLIKAALGSELGDIYLGEMLVDNVLVNLTPEEINALISGFVSQYKDKRNYHFFDYFENIEME